MKKRFLLLFKNPVRGLSLFVCLCCWILLCAPAVFIVRGMEDRARLVRDNENERIFNTLFTGLREYDDFGSAIEANPVLSERIAGFAIYDDRLLPLYTWRKVPPSFDEELLGNKMIQNRFGRFTVPDKKNKSVKFILSTEVPDVPAMPQNSPNGQHGGMRMRRRIIERQNFPFFNTLARGRYYYIDIFHPDYWRTVSVSTALFNVSCAALLAIVLSLRHLYLRNREYRERIEAQKNLVVLGTAAGTLAHEIKTPLSSIRLQTGILEKLYTGEGRDELSIINEEVDRLSSLSRRINDYLREGKGDPSAINLYDLVLDTGVRLCGRNIMTKDSLKEAWIFADLERIRSVFENLIRNAMESGGPVEELDVQLDRAGGSISAHVRDRGKGIPEGDLDRIFDLFFTKKSSGTGIGLSICKRFVEAAGGSISIRNRNAGAGTPEQNQSGVHMENGTEAVVAFPEYKIKEGGTP